MPFRTLAPQVDESPKADEGPRQLSERLAIAKAQAVARQLAKGLVIGSDQVASLDGRPLGKPGDHQTAKRQLLACSGKRVTFFTGLCVIDVASGKQLSLTETFEVSFRHLTGEQIERYLEKDQPYDCAGSFKCEGLGISLFTGLHGRDPNSLIGLPLIALCDLLKEFGVEV